MRGQRCVYFSTVTDYAAAKFAELGPAYTALLSADLNESGLGGAYYATDEQVKTLGSRGGRVEAWCDGDQTPIEHALEFARTRGLAGVSAQFESDEQYGLLVGSKVGLGIGNPSALTRTLADAIARVDRGELVLIGEVMIPKPDYSARGINIASACFYVDRDEAQGGYQPLERFAVMPAGMRHTCSVYTGGRMSEADWRLYAEWTRP